MTEKEGWRGSVGPTVASEGGRRAEALALLCHMLLQLQMDVDRVMSRWPKSPDLRPPPCTHLSAPPSQPSKQVAQRVKSG